MLLLALDTATAAVTVALHDGSRVIAERVTVDARRHGELVAPEVAAVLAAAGASPGDLTEIVVGVGPGPFTGLRIGLVTARVMGLAAGVPVRGVCSLDILAHDVPDAGPCAVATDARRKEVYWAVYDEARRRVEGPVVVRPSDLDTTGTGWPVAGLPVAGVGPRLYPGAFPKPTPPEYPSAATLARGYVDGAVEVLPPEPLYLRRPDARPPGPRKSVLAR